MEEKTFEDLMREDFLMKVFIKNGSIGFVMTFKKSESSAEEILEEIKHG